eukprot:jgi/Psemu1/42233/gm1.42233_g
MKHIAYSLLPVLLVLVLEPDSGNVDALILPSFRKLTQGLQLQLQSRRQPSLLFSGPAPAPIQKNNAIANSKNKNAKHQPSDVMLTEMRADIARMKKEAAERLEALNEKLVVVSRQKEEEEKARAMELQHRHATNTKAMAEAKTMATAKIAAEAKTMAKLNAKATKQPETKPATNGNSAPLNVARTLESLTEMADEFQRDMGQMTTATTATTTTTSSDTDETEPTTSTATTVATTAADTKHPLKLLDDTRWRLCLSVGRVPGTWMPKTWGASGDKLHLKLEVEFTHDELYAREDFFNGISDGSKVLRVVHNEASLAPSMHEGGRTVRVTDGGWRVCPSEGALGTHLLRFYFDVEEEARHLGSDVYLPKGRVFGTCGYFPMIGRSNVDGRRTSKRELYQQELRQMEVKHMSLQTELDNDPDWFSLAKLRRFREIRDLRKDVRKIQRAMDEETIREPKKSSLRLSRDQSVGLTQEGGICCKKTAGLTDEYHILGMFEIASIENREHSDYKDALRP